MSDDPLWYKDAVFYELYGKTFQDSIGDGIGDFNGLIQRFDYAQELDVSCSRGTRSVLERVSSWIDVRMAFSSVSENRMIVPGHIE